MGHDDTPRWLDKPSTHELIWRVLVGACVALVVLELIGELGWHTGHPHFGFDALPGFHGLFGFVAFVTAVMLGKQLRKSVKRDEDYYDPQERP